MLLETRIIILFLHSRVASRLRIRDLHGLLEQIEAIQRLQSLTRFILRTEDDESLTASPVVLLGDDVDNLAELAEDFAELLDQGGDFDVLVQVLDLQEQISDVRDPGATGVRHT